MVIRSRAGKSRRPALLAVAAGLVALVSARGAPAEEGVFWQGATPEHGTAVAAAVGRELRIPLDAVGPLGSTVSVTARRLPAGAVIRPSAVTPGRSVFSWRPRRRGEWTLFFRASAGSAHAPPLKVYVHVGGRASRSFRLSNVVGRSQNAMLARPVVARARPSDSARAVTRLRTVTPEGVPHLLYLVAGKIDRNGRYWLRVQLPILPNGSTGWIPRDAVGSFRFVDTHLVIDRARFRATLYRQGRAVFSSIVGVGLPHWPTPGGRFYIRERLTGFSDPIYGAIAFGTNGRSAVLTDWPGGGFIGIHGTNQPQILPGRVSHGCIRLPNPSIRRLDRLMRTGTPVTIR